MPLSLSRVAEVETCLDYVHITDVCKTADLFELICMQAQLGPIGGPGSHSPRRSNSHEPCVERSSWQERMPSG